MVLLLAIGAAACTALGLLVVTVLDGVAEDHVGAGVVPYGSPSGWWPDADQPVDVALTDRGRIAAELPQVYCLEPPDPRRSS
jgi:hypothetical protein